MNQSQGAGRASRRASGPRMKEEEDDARNALVTPESLMDDALKMTKALEKLLKAITIPNETRKEAWDTEIKALKDAIRNQRPKLLTAVCGGTGAGKSSLLNAILQDNIVPTSGIQACTSVVTKISYHKNKQIRAEVFFLSVEEWRNELRVVLRDLQEEGTSGPGGITATTEEGRIALDKMRAVYPNQLDELLDMDVEAILTHNQDVYDKLGTRHTITAPDSKTFREKIGKYIDSSDQNDPAEGDFALWPLIKEVHIMCKAEALKTGVVLVDLPGSADANAARDNVAKNYLKDAKRIWIAAEITRAVDNQVAKTLLGDHFRTQLLNDNYHEHCITFIATKTDDVASSEITRALRLDKTPRYKEIESRLEALQTELEEIAERERTLAQQVKAVGSEIQALDHRQQTITQRLQMVLEGEPLALEYPMEEDPKDKKRKLEDDGKSGQSKKARSSAHKSSDNGPLWETMGDMSEEESGESDDELDALGEPDVDAVDTEADASGSDDLLHFIHDPDSLLEMREEIDGQLMSLTPQRDKLCQEANILLERKEVALRSHSEAQMEKDCLCALARNKFAKTKLKQDFRAGIKETEDLYEMDTNPANFDPTQNIRDYGSIDLPVFTCSSRDYARSRAQAEGDGDASCFLDPEDTEIPALQRYCHELTLPLREKDAERVLVRTKALAQGIKAYVEHIQNSAATAQNRTSLRRRWDSNFSGRGIARTLRAEFHQLSKKCSADLEQNFKNCLQEKCQEGVQLAIDGAVETVDEFSKIHWSSYRATIRRNGEWKGRDFNERLIDPFNKHIAQQFREAFKERVLGPFEVSARNVLARFEEDFLKSAGDDPDLTSGAITHGKVCRGELKATLQTAMTAVDEALTSGRRTISRSTKPSVKESLRTAYEAARAEKGKGCVARQRACMREFVEANSNNIFKKAGDAVLLSLKELAEQIGETLNGPLDNLSQKVEVAFAVLWEEIHTSADENGARQNVTNLAAEILAHLPKKLGALLKEPVEDEDGDVHPF